MTSPVRLPSLEGLQAVEAAARLGTFERAGEALAVTASAVSKRVAAVEDLLGTPLFVRGPRSLALTPAGREYLQQVAPALALLNAVPQHRAAQARTGKLRVCTPPTFARQILVPALASFTESHPAIELELLLSVPFLDVRGGDADVEVRFGDASLGTPLLMDPVRPVAAPALLQRLPPLREPSDLAHATLLRTPLEPWTPWFRAAGLPWPEPVAGPKFLDLGLTLEAAVAGQGVALARPTLARHWRASGSLVPLFEVLAQPTQGYHLLPHTDQGPAALFAQWLAGVCRAAQAEAARIG